MEQLPILSRQEFDNILSQVGQIVLDWFNMEINRLSRHTVIFRKINKNAYLIGSMFMFKNVGDRWSVIHNDKLVNEFYYRSSALFYCLSWIDNDISRAKEILNLDRTLNNRLSDHENFRYSLQNTKLDEFKKSVIISRYSENQSKINLIKDRLQKTIIDAKYKKTRNSHESYRN